jgi:hypothetical protein
MIPDPSLWVEKESRWETEEHYEERKKQGFSTADWINFDTYIAWVIACAVEKMKSDGHTMFTFEGVPESEWLRLTHEEYDVMIKGFGNWSKEGHGLDIDYKTLVEDLDAALDIFKKRFRSLWD